MKKLLKTIALLPMYPLIWLSGAKAEDPIDEFSSDCHANGVRMLRWRNA